MPATAWRWPIGQDSKYASEINAENWYEILSRPDVKVGLADPRFDAVGYRALMVYALARDYYHQPTIFTDMFKGQFSFPLGIFSEDNLTTVTVPEIVETKTNSHIVLRGASMELIALLESGDLDYAFEYESVIHQHRLEHACVTRCPQPGRSSRPTESTAQFK